VEELPYLHHLLITHTPPTPEALAGFLAASGDWVFKDPNTLEPLAVELTPTDYATRLKSMGYTVNDSTWWAIDAHFKGLGAIDPATGTRETISIPDKVYLGRRTRAAPSQVTFNFTTNTGGNTIFKIDPARYVFPDAVELYSRAAIQVESDGVLTVGDLRDDAIAQLTAKTAFTALYAAAAGGGAGDFTVTSAVDGQPLVTEFFVTTPGPNVTMTVTTANVAGDYALDLAAIQRALADVEKNPLQDRPGRKFYWITDLQGDDIVNAEGMKFVQDQRDPGLFNPPRDYQFRAWSTTGDKIIFRGAARIGNFDPSATASAAQEAQQANGGEGWSCSGVHDHPRYEFEVPALLGRVIGHMPGVADFTSKELVGQTRFSRMSPIDHGDNETLADTRCVDWYSDDGDNGSHKFGYMSNGSFCDRQWVEDYATYLGEKDLTAWRILRNTVQYTDADIEAGASVLADALAKIPAIITDTIRVTWVKRKGVNPNNLAQRIYVDYTATCQAAGVINKLGTSDEPIEITIAETP
jgi:hypothetical protein